MTDLYRKNLRLGQEFQDFAVQQLYKAGIVVVGYSSFKYQTEVGENVNGYEIKFDNRMSETGNVYFESGEKTNPNNSEYIASGIFRNDNTWMYVIGNYKIIYLCAKKSLRIFYERALERKRNKLNTIARFKETPTSQGMILPQKYVEEQLAAMTLRF